MMILDASGNQMGDQADTLDRLYQVQTKKLRESLDLWDKYVDPTDAFRGPRGELWSRIGSDMSYEDEESRFLTIEDLKKARMVCRALAFSNEFAINGHENRISYVIGTGHTYLVTAKKGETVADTKLKEVQTVVMSSWC